MGPENKTSKMATKEEILAYAKEHFGRGNFSWRQMVSAYYKEQRDRGISAEAMIKTHGAGRYHRISNISCVDKITGREITWDEMYKKASQTED